MLLPFSFISTLCFLGGAAFGYFVVFPPAFRFLISYSSEFLDPMPAVSEYFSLALRLLLAFGVIFELPVFMVFLAKLGTVDAPFLAKNRKYAFLMAFIVAAVITPTPDVVNQLLMAGPLVVLYEISIVAVRFFAQKTLVEIGEEETEDTEEGEVKYGGEVGDGRPVLACPTETSPNQRRHSLNILFSQEGHFLPSKFL
jgi:sec-independent protein translocase protein TatC